MAAIGAGFGLWESSAVVASYRRRRLWGITEKGVGAGNGGGRALIQASPMRSGFSTAATARAWIVDLLAAAAHRQAEQWWGYDDDGEPAIHGRPLKRLRNRTGLARSLLDRRIQLRLSQQVVADAPGFPPAPSSTPSSGLGHGPGYEYPYDDRRGWVPQQYRPPELAGRVYYGPSDHGAEREVGQRMRHREGQDPVTSDPAGSGQAGVDQGSDQ